MRYWWVNQNQTYRAEVRGSFMWSPKRNANGARNQFYENMGEVSPGDIVFSFCDTRIKAIGVVTGGAQTGPKPDFGNAGLNWSKEGWPDSEAGAAVDATLTGPTFREQIVRARRGQGVFRANVLLREDACRVTRVNEPRHLKAGHIKPWRDATDAERLDGSNGLLLSPHIDHLFDEGYITFSSSQQVVIVPEVRDKLLDAWGIDAGVRVGEFTREQNAYLDYHRANVFKRALLE